MSRTLKLLAIGMIALLATGCSQSVSEEAESTTTTDGQWPRTITHEAGETTIPEQPLRIVSTSPSITGTLLAVDAPVVGTASALVTSLADDKGFFTQWADVADERGVEVVYSNLEIDLDAIDSFEPDLIIGAISGGDSVAAEYDQLSDIAPTVLLNYAEPSWQELTETVAEITGHEDDAQQILAEYDEFVSEQASLISLPEQPVTVLSYMGADGGWVLDADSQQGLLLDSIGFDYVGVAPEFASQSNNGVSQVSPENLPAALEQSQTLFLMPTGGPTPIEEFTGNALLANLPAVKNQRVFDLGDQSFRLDYYSARSTVEHVVSLFK
ncbi:iron-enterobactin transporter periplasmic binding protein [Corynebacterium suranareeae]|uniref:Iron-enterobactin transporter periplasmic binding protein n=1 Tax=Corynebacterium suranareeae TaxID=2506452 RepID=A0A160PQ18_9CORY|nr:Fe2+-enterobactin ABC transporter substrate-binding protein [Corynebacterium suranareeae]BAU94290.1 iron-enterobactin transporter periplasmic binding protein [Corynebacterium suranareeae]